MELIGYLYFAIVMSLICGVVWFYVGLIVYQRCADRRPGQTSSLCTEEERHRITINDDDTEFYET